MKVEHLLVIDMQTGFMADKVTPQERSATLVINSLEARARRLGIPVTYSVQSSDKYGFLIPQMNPASPDEIVDTQYNDAFTSPVFADRVNQSGPLAICGRNLEFCVLATAVSAVQNGYHTWVVKDAVISRDRDSFLKWLSKIYFSVERDITYSNFKD